MATLNAQGLSKSYKGSKVVDSVDFEINSGLVGPKGSRKNHMLKLNRWRSRL